MPLLNNNEKDISHLEDWLAVRRFVKETFGKRPDINAILFLIGMNEVGQVKETWSKEEKQELMHVAVCRLFENEGYYQFMSEDKDGWPHFENIKPLPNIHLKEQETWLKEKIIQYFKIKNYI
ncbi:MAG: hypothetical protein LRY27_02720 [Chitinophagales bacterium]|nr:hypothetical protein [Chitinophagales bacterium]